MFRGNLLKIPSKASLLLAKKHSPEESTRLGSVDSGNRSTKIPSLSLLQNAYITKSQILAFASI